MAYSVSHKVPSLPSGVTHTENLSVCICMNIYLMSVIVYVCLDVEVCLWMCVYEYMSVGVYMCGKMQRSENNLQETVSSFSPTGVAFGYRTLLVSLGSKHLSPLCRLMGPQFCLFWKLNLELCAC